jgi:F-type H+-transporting ATPase subunit alpha
MSLEEEIIVLFAGTNGFADQVSLENMKAWEAALLRYMSTSHPHIGKDIAERKLISQETEVKLREALQAFGMAWKA